MIRGITDVHRPPRLGKIRLGEKAISKRGAEYPKALDHFNFRDVPELEAIYGANCREIYPVMIPLEDEDQWFRTSLSAYGKSGLFCRCSDGETATRVYVPVDKQGHAFVTEQGIDIAEGEMFDMPCPHHECPYFRNAKCKAIGRLSLFVPDSPRFGTYEIVTSSWHSIVNVLNMGRSIREAAGRIAMIPLALRLVPIQVQPEGRAKTVHVLELEYRDGGVRGLLKMRRDAPKQLAQSIEVGDDVPDDLYPNAGAALDSTLGKLPATAPTQPAEVPTRPPAAGRFSETSRANEAADGGEQPFDPDADLDATQPPAAQGQGPSRGVRDATSNEKQAPATPAGAPEKKAAAGFLDFI